MIDFLGWLIALWLLLRISADMRAMRQRTDYYYDSLRIRDVPGGIEVAGAVGTGEFGDTLGRPATIPFPNGSPQPPSPGRAS